MDSDTIFEKETNVLRNYFLDKIKDTLLETNLGFVQKLDINNPKIFYNYLEAEKELNKPTEPWTELLNALLDYELGFDFLKYSIKGLISNMNGREVHFFIQTFSIYMRSCLERFEHLIKKMIRKKVISNNDEILNLISMAITNPGLIELRHTSAHGRFTGTNRKITDTQTDFYWEPYSIIRLDINHIQGWHQAHKNNLQNLKDSYIKQYEEFLLFNIQILRGINDLINKYQHTTNGI